MFIPAFFKVVPNKIGGILTTSTRVDMENNCEVNDKFEFMNLWIIFPNFSENLHEIASILKFP